MNFLCQTSSVFFPFVFLVIEVETRLVCFSLQRSIESVGFRARWDWDALLLRVRRPP
jgi:hypothetical protein